MFYLTSDANASWRRSYYIFAWISSPCCLLHFKHISNIIIQKHIDRVAKEVKKKSNVSLNRQERILLKEKWFSELQEKHIEDLKK